MVTLMLSSQITGCQEWMIWRGGYQRVKDVVGYTRDCERKGKESKNAATATATVTTTATAINKNKDKKTEVHEHV